MFLAATSIFYNSQSLVPEENPQQISDSSRAFFRCTAPAALIAMVFLNASFQNAPSNASANDSSYYYISLPAEFDDEVAVAIPVHAGFAQRFADFFNLPFEESAIFLPETFYYIVSEKPDFLGPFMISCAMVAIQALHQAFLPSALPLNNHLKRILLIVLSLFIYVVVIPVIFGLVKFRFFHTERPIAVHDTCLMICAIGYSLSVCLPFKLLCLLSDEFYFIGFSLSVFLTFSLMIRVCEKISFKRVEMLPATPESVDASKNTAVKCVWLLSCLGFTAYTWTLLLV